MVEEEPADKGPRPSPRTRGNESRQRCPYRFVFEQSEFLSRNEAYVAELSQDMERVAGPVRFLSRHATLTARPQGILC